MNKKRWFTCCLFLLLFTFIVGFPSVNIFANSTESLGKSYRELMSTIRTFASEEDAEIATQLKTDLYEQIDYILNQPFADDSYKSMLLEKVEQKDIDGIQKVMLQLSYQALDEALIQKDYEAANAWYEIRENKFKFDREASAGLRAIVELKNNPENGEMLAPIIMEDLTNTYLFKLKEALSKNEFKLAMQYFQIIENKLEQQLDTDNFSLLKDILVLANDNEENVTEDDRLQVQQIIASYSLKNVSDEEIQQELKKIVTLLDYLKRNWIIAIKDGQVFNGVEFAELKAFIKDAKQRFLQIESTAGDNSQHITEELNQIEANLLNHVNTDQAAQQITSLIDLFVEIGGDSILPKQNVSEDDPTKAIDSTKELLTLAKQSNDNGKQKEALDYIFEAYFSFEPMESTLSVQDNKIVQDIELLFNEIRSKIQSNNSIDEPFSKLNEKLAEAQSILTGQTSAWGLFLQSLLIILREGFEAILVISALVAYLRKTGHLAETRYIYIGAITAILASFLSAYLIRSVLKLSGANQEVLEGVTMLIAVVVLFYVSYWLISKAQGDKWQNFIEGKLQQSIGRRNLLTMGFVSFLAVYREGFETILFYQALLAIGDDSSMILYGFLVGCLLLTILYIAIAKYSIRIPIKPFFLGTSILLYALAFTFAGNGIFELQEGGVVSSTYLSWAPTVPILGLFPTIETILAQSILIIALLFALFVILRKKKKQTLILKEGA